MVGLVLRQGLEYITRMLGRDHVTEGKAVLN